MGLVDGSGVAPDEEQSSKAWLSSEGLRGLFAPAALACAIVNEMALWEGERTGLTGRTADGNLLVCGSQARPVTHYSL